jgi:hypothetical protein
MARAFIALAGILLCYICAQVHAAAPTGAELPGEAPEQVTVGIYIQDIYGFNFADGSYRISGYLWWKFRSAEFNPLESAEIVNARDVRMTQAVRRTLPDGQRYVASSFFATINQQLNAAGLPVRFPPPHTEHRNVVLG